MKRFPKTIRTLGRYESILDESRILVSFRAETKIEEVRDLVKELNLRPEGDRERGTFKHWIQINNTRRRFWLRSIEGTPIDQRAFTQIEKRLGDRVDWIAPVYRTAETPGATNFFSPIPTVLLVKKGKQTDVGRLSEEFGLRLNEEKSKYLTAYYYFEVPDLKRANAFELKEKLEKSAGEVKFENMPMYKPLTTTTPNDTLWANQWDMAQINAPDGWDISTGANSVVICVLDEGCDLTHPDLQFSENGINLDDPSVDGSPTGNHGTACAGIAAATFNNSAGVAGVAGSCRIMPLAFENWSDAECAVGINYATTNGADVISMSFGVYDGWGWDYTIIDPEIQNAHTNGVVMCVATGNEDDGTTNRYPGRHPLVIAVGGSDQNDNRKTPASPDGECWGANFGEDVYDGATTGVSVVAPCVLCPTTDRQGANGYYDGTGAINDWACVDYPSPGTADGDYIFMFDGTSAATPHVAGLAGLLRSQYPALTNVQVRNIIERSAAKVGALAYAEQAGFANGTRNQEMGYGRIDVFRALDFADVMIKDWTGDTGAEPSTSGNFWDYSDIVVRINDDNVFNPSNPSQSKNVERGQTNYIYVQVTNNGPRDARNVTVNFRITPYVGLQFVYPNDWTASDAMHVSPTPITNTFASVPAGTTVLAKFSISAAQVEDLYGWQFNNPWHPCLLAEVTADNDYAFASADLSFGNVVVRKNNAAQRNLSVIDVLASPGLTLAFPFVAGSRFSKAQSIRLNIDRSKLPKEARVQLEFNGDGKAFPLVDFTSPEDAGNESFVFQDRTKVVTRIGCCDVLLTLEKRSKLEFLCGRKNDLKVRNIRGGRISIEEGEQIAAITDDKSVVEFDSRAGTIYPMALRIDFPDSIRKGDEYAVTVFQTDERNQPLGGATTIYYVK